MILSRSDEIWVRMQGGRLPVEFSYFGLGTFYWNMCLHHAIVSFDGRHIIVDGYAWSVVLRQYSGERDVEERVGIPTNVLGI
jgi:hypothetical protein